MALDDEKLPTMALSSSDKNNIIAFLVSAYARNRINIAEYERRLDLLNNINTKEDLTLLVNDLIIDSREITDVESITLKMENRNFARSTLLTKKLLISIKYSTIVLDYTDIDLPDGKYEIQMNGDIANITIKAPIQYTVENQISSQMVTINESKNDETQKWKRSVILKLTGKLKKSEINIVRVS